MEMGRRTSVPLRIPREAVGFVAVRGLARGHAALLLGAAGAIGFVSGNVALLVGALGVERAAAVIGASLALYAWSFRVSLGER